jgi:hypothetical protein
MNVIYIFPFSWVQHQSSGWIPFLPCTHPSKYLVRYSSMFPPQSMIDHLAFKDNQRYWISSTNFNLAKVEVGCGGHKRRNKWLEEKVQLGSMTNKYEMAPHWSCYSQDTRSLVPQYSWKEGAGGRGWGFCTCYKVFSLRQACCNLVEVFFNVEQGTLHNHMCLRYVDLLDLDHQIGGFSISLPITHNLQV